MLILIYLLVPPIAFLYASVGFGGATSYLAVMSLFGISPQVMSSTALTLNIVVAGISFTSFYRAGHLRSDLLAPFLVTSVPAAFAGGYFRISDQLYILLLYLVLTFVAIQLLFFSKVQDESQPLRPAPTSLSLGAGLLIGLLSGMLGIGGGIFLSPVIIYARWGRAKQASAIAAAFIVLNSASGLLGRLLAGSFHLDTFSLSLLPLAIIGGLAGSFIGAKRLSGLNLRRALGTVLSLVVANFWLSYFN
jgi:uncharacterized protein